MGKDRSGGRKRSRKSSLEWLLFSRFLEVVLGLEFGFFDGGNDRNRARGYVRSHRVVNALVVNQFDYVELDSTTACRAKCPR